VDGGGNSLGWRLLHYDEWRARKSYCQVNDAWKALGTVSQCRWANAWALINGSRYAGLVAPQRVFRPPNTYQGRSTWSTLNSGTDALSRHGVDSTATLRAVLRMSSAPPSPLIAEAAPHPPDANFQHHRSTAWSAARSRSSICRWRRWRAVKLEVRQYVLTLASLPGNRGTHSFSVEPANPHRQARRSPSGGAIPDGFYSSRSASRTPPDDAAGLRFLQHVTLHTSIQPQLVLKWLPSYAFPVTK